MAAQPGEGEYELSRLEEAANKAYDEYFRLEDEWDRLNVEVEELDRRLKESVQDEEKKVLEGQLKKAIARRDLADAKQMKATFLCQQRKEEKERAQLVIKSGDTSGIDSEIRKCKEAVVKWEKEIKQRQQLLLEIEQDEVFQVTKIEGYTCVGRSVLCLVYLPDTVPPINVDIQSVSDNTVHPKMSANEILLTPVVSITSQSQTLAMDKPVVIELMKTAEVDAVGDNKIVPMFSDTDDSIPPNWEDLHEDCEVLGDRFRFKTTHFTYFAVIARFSPPTASVTVNPESDFVGELTVPELPGFSVTIPPKSVQSPIEAKATLYYDETEEWKGSANEQLASACVRLEPEGQKFSEKVSVILPIPGYSEVIAANPGAKPLLMYRPNGSSNNWEIQEDMKIVELEGEFVARFSTDHFSDWRLSWEENVRKVTKAIGSIFKHDTSFHCRCQVFMSCETEVGSVLNFSLQGLVYQFQDPPQEIPHNYHYILHDSGTLPIRVPSGELSFTVELNKCLIPDKEDEEIRFQKSRKLSHDSPARPKFCIKLNKTSKAQLKEGAIIADFSVHNSDGLIHDCDLIKPSQMEVSDRHQLAPSSDVITVFLPSLTATTKLGEESLKDITSCLWPARFKWRQIGIALEIDASTLEVIHEDHRRVDDCFLDVIIKWLKNGKHVPCWKVLAEALSSPPVEVAVEETSKEDDTKSKDVCTAQLIEDEKERDNHGGRSEGFEKVEKGKGNDIDDLFKAESSGNEHYIPESENKVSQDKDDADRSQGNIEKIKCEQTKSLESPLTVTEEVVEKSNKGYIGTEDSAGVSDSDLVNAEDKGNVTEVPSTIVRRISPWWFLTIAILLVCAFVFVCLVWFLDDDASEL